MIPVSPAMAFFLAASAVSVRIVVGAFRVRDARRARGARRALADGDVEGFRRGCFSLASALIEASHAGDTRPLETVASDR